MSPDSRRVRTPLRGPIILLRGDVTLILDQDEVRLKPFDVVVQRGTNHAGRNNRNEPALLAGVLIDALPVQRPTK